MDERKNNSRRSCNHLSNNFISFILESTSCMQINKFLLAELYSRTITLLGVMSI